MKLQSFEQFLNENKELFYEIHLFYQRDDKPNDLYLIPEKDLYLIDQVIDIEGAVQDGYSEVNKKDLLSVLPKIKKYWYGRYAKGTLTNSIKADSEEIVVDVVDEDWDEDYYVKNEVQLSIENNKLSKHSKTYEVYRYENPDTYIGPHRGHSWEDDDMEKNTTTSGLKDDYYWADDPTEQQWLEARSKIYLSGCESVSQLQKWFGVFNERILKANFVIAKYTVTKVLESKSNTQLAFCADDVLDREVV